MSYWLMKSEADCYSIDDLKKDKQTMWDGIRNYQVRNMIRDDIMKGDLVLFYHSNAGIENGVMGEMEVVKEAYPDPTQFDPTSEHFDSKSDQRNPRWLCVDVKFKSKFPRLVSLKEIKNDPAFADMVLTKKGNRLSVMPVSAKHYARISKLGTQ